MQDNLVLKSSDIYHISNNNIIFKKKFKLQNIIFYVRKIHMINTFNAPTDKEKSKIFTLTYSFKTTNSEIPNFKVLKSIVRAVVKELNNIKKVIANKNGFVDMKLNAHNDDIIVQLIYSKNSVINVDVE